MASDQLQIKEKDENIIVYLNGKLDVQRSSQIELSLDDLRVKNPNSNIILEMSRVEHMSSSGLRVLVALMRELNAKGYVLRLCKLSKSVEKIFEIVELTDMFDIYKTEDSALKGLRE